MTSDRPVYLVELDASLRCFSVYRRVERGEFRESE